MEAQLCQFGQHFKYVTVDVWQKTHVKRDYVIQSKCGGKKIGNIGGGGPKAFGPQRRAPGPCPRPGVAREDEVVACETRNRIQREYVQTYKSICFTV